MTTPYEHGSKAISRVDETAARIHRQRALLHFDAAERFRKLGLADAEQAARDAAQAEDELADALQGKR